MSINRSVVEIHLFLTVFGLYKIVIFLLSVVCHYHSRKCDFGFKSWMPLVLSTCYIRQYITFAIAYVSIYFNEALQRGAQISCFSGIFLLAFPSCFLCSFLFFSFFFWIQCS